MLVLLLGLGVSVSPVHAQTPAQAGTLVVTVVDSTGAVLPGATVTVTGIEAANKAATIEPVKATDQGVATIPKLLPGRYSVQAEFQGFETRMLPDVRVRSGNNKQVLMLPIEGHKEAVVVGQDKQAAAADPRGSSFGTTLTREQLANLSDDPEVLRQQLMDMAGPGAVITRRQLRRRGAAEQVADPIDPHLARSVRRGIPRGGRYQCRDHHAAGHGADADERQLSACSAIR